MQNAYKFYFALIWIIFILNFTEAYISYNNFWFFTIPMIYYFLFNLIILINSTLKYIALNFKNHFYNNIYIFFYYFHYFWLNLNIFKLLDFVLSIKFLYFSFPFLNHLNQLSQNSHTIFSYFIFLFIFINCYFF